MTKNEQAAKTAYETAVMSALMRTTVPWDNLPPEIRQQWLDGKEGVYRRERP